MSMVKGLQKAVCVCVRFECMCTICVFAGIREWEWCAVPHRHSFLCLQWSIVTRCHYQTHDLTPLTTSSCTTVLNVSWGSRHRDDRLCMIRCTCCLFLWLCKKAKHLCNTSWTYKHVQAPPGLGVRSCALCTCVFFVLLGASSGYTGFLTKSIDMF